MLENKRSLANSGSNSKSGRGEDMLEYEQDCFDESPAVAMLQQIQNETYQINICGKKVTFDARDPIFQLTAPCTQQIPSSQCACCEKDLGTKGKTQYCQFCG